MNIFDCSEPDLVLYRKIRVVKMTLPRAINMRKMTFRALPVAAFTKALFVKYANKLGLEHWLSLSVTRTTSEAVVLPVRKSIRPKCSA